MDSICYTDPECIHLSPPLSLSSCCVCVCVCVLSHSLVSDTLWPYGLCSMPAPLSMGFPRQEYWSGLPIPPPVDLPNLGTECMSFVLPTCVSYIPTFATLVDFFFFFLLLSHLGSHYPPITCHHSFSPGLSQWKLTGLFNSVDKLCLTLCDPMEFSPPGLPVHHQLPEFTQTLLH